MTVSKEEEFLKLLEKSLRKVLSDPNITTKERLSAIQVGSALVEKQSKMKKPKDTKFFKGA